MKASIMKRVLGPTRSVDPKYPSDCRQPEPPARVIAMMRAAKYLLAGALSLVLIAGMLGSQICDYNCALHGCSLSFPVPTSQNTNERAHCHQHKQNTAPQKHNDSQQCVGHFDAVALASSRAPAYTVHQVPSAHALITPPTLFVNASPQGLVVQSGRKPERSPPAHSVLRI